MTKRIIYFLAVIALLGLITLGGVYGWLSHTDLSSLSRKIEQRVEAETGRALAIKGGIRVYPGIRSTIVLHDVQFSNAPWAKGPVLFSAKKMVLTLSSWRLLTGDVRLSAVTITGLDGHLQTQDNGEANWDALLNPPKTQEAEQAAVQVKRLVITDSHITYNSDDELTLHRAIVKMRHRDHSIFLRLAGALNKEALKVEGTVKQWNAMDKKKVPLHFTAKLGQVKLAMKGAISTNKKRKSPWLKGAIAVDAVALSDLNPIFHVQLPSVQPVSLRSHVIANKDDYTLDAFTAHIGEGVFEGKVDFTPQKGSELWRLDIKGNAADAGLLLKQLGITQEMQGGTLYVDADVWTHGNTLAEKKRALNGAANLGIYNAHVHHENNPNIAKGFVSVLAGTNLPSKIKMNCLVASFTIEEGIAKTNALVFDTKGAVVAGKGSINLSQNTLNLTLNLNKKGPSLTPLKTPYRVRGPLDNPSILPGVSGGMVVGAVFSAVTGIGVVGFLAANVVQNLGGSLMDRSVCGKLLQKKPEENH